MERPDKEKLIKMSFWRATSERKRACLFCHVITPRVIVGRRNEENFIELPLCDYCLQGIIDCPKEFFSC